MSTLPIGYSVRLAIITRVFKTQVECTYTDREGEHSVRCPMPYPFAGAGVGVFVGPEKDTRVLISLAPQEQAYIVAVIPDRSYYFDQSGVKDSPVSSSEYPTLRSGEVCLKGPLSSRIELLKNGNMCLDANTGDFEADVEFSRLAKGIFTRTNNAYKFTEAGREIDGIIRRDISSVEDIKDTKTINFLSGESYDSFLADVGRNPTIETAFRTAKISKFTVRNPALVEKRSIVYEYANSYGVRGIPSEAKAVLNIDKNSVDDGFANLSADTSTRENRRTDILNLNPKNYNHLIEKVEGTVVDVYGNILDINRNVIGFDSGAGEIDTTDGGGSLEDLQRIYRHLSRSVKYHFEINSRKNSQENASTADLPITPETISNNAQEHSRWSIDVDGEGLTKINIPASSETGNIPILARSVVSKNKDPNEESGQFRDEGRKDIRSIPFGKGPDADVTIADSKYVPEPVAKEYKIKLGTAHHDFTQIAKSVFETGKFNADPVSSLDRINNKISDRSGFNEDANAGGRSLQTNLDGSAEISLGADTINRRSLALDLAGGVISHYGRDINGRSVIHQTDGDIIIQVGGPGISSDKRFNEDKDTEDRPGRIEIHLNRGAGAKSQKIIIDENGITFDIYGNGLIQTSGDLTLRAKGSLLLDGENVSVYGDVDAEIDGDRSILGSEKLIVRDGRKI